jgi:predicted nucleic acid-binding Zn ribbon protein
LATQAGVYGFYRWQNVAINVWSGQPTAEAVQVMTELTERSLSECPRGIASIHWLDPGVGLPTPEARVRLGELARRYPKHVSCVGVLLQGSGFWASATRSALTGVMLLAPRTFALRFFGEVGELSAYIVQEQALRGDRIDAESLMAAIDDAVRDSKQAG